MRKRFKPSERLPVRARPGNPWVQIGKVCYEFPLVRRRYTMSDKESLESKSIVISTEEDKIFQRLPRVIFRQYNATIQHFRKEVNKVLGDVYVVIPHCPECSISDAVAIIKQLQDEPTDIVAIEICKQLKL